ncbi:hypothetical protein D9M69_486290 [compost metagenome]
MLVDACIVNQYLEGPGLGYHLLHPTQIGDVKTDGLPTNLIGQLFGADHVLCGDHHLGALGG